MKIAVIEDERPARSELIFLLNEILENPIIDQASSGSEGLSLIGENTYDIIFIDIHLGDIKGIDLVPLIKKINPETKIVFSTAYSDYATKAFELQVDDYILKPYNQERIAQVLQRLCLHNNSPCDTANKVVEKISINKDRESILIDVNNIVYIETDGQGRGCIIHTIDNEYINNTYLAEYEKKLINKCFFRIHKSYLINLKYVISIFPWESGRFALKLKGYEKNILPIGRDKIKELRQLILL